MDRVILGVGIAVVAAATRIVKIPEPVGWGGIAVGIAIIVSSALPSRLMPTLAQGALYALSIGLLAGTIAWHAVDVSQRPALAQADLDALQLRRLRTLQNITNLYMASHDGISPRMMAGLELAPIEFLNVELERQNADWRVSSVADLNFEAASVSPAHAATH